MKILRRSRLARSTLLLMMLAGCQLVPLPMGELRGEERRVESFDFASEYRILQLETRPADPYSVNLRVTVIDGELFIDAGDRRWHEHLQEDPRVRVRLGRFVYPAIAIEVSDPNVKKRFSSSRTVYRLEPSAPPQGRSSAL